MRKLIFLLSLAALTASCAGDGGDRKGNSPAEGREIATNEGLPAGTADVTDNDSPTGAQPGTAESLNSGTELPTGAVLIATDIVTEVIIRPDPEGDPWETEKVAGYKGDVMVESIFSRIYEGTLTVYDYHSGEPLTTADVRKIEGEFKNDRSKIGKLSFTEDWYYYPSENRVEKKAKSVTFGYELYNNLGKVYAYRAAFRADFQ